MAVTSSRIVRSAAKTFYEKIGRPKFISAPMVDHSSLPWRLLVKSNGVDLAYSQMIHARQFVMSRKFRVRMIDWEDYSPTSGDDKMKSSAQFLDSNLIVQLAGDDAATLVAAGKFIHHNVAAIDLNLGCPQKIAKKGHYGSYLLPDKDLVVSLLSAMVNQLECPITAKIRILPNKEETLTLCKAIEDCGVSMLTIHGRERTASKSNIGPADWDIIRLAKEALSIPVIANGGISCRADALRCLEYTGADGIMSSEALLENPKLFSLEGDKLFREDYIRTQLQSARELLENMKGYYAHRCQAPLMMRSHLFKMLTRFLSVPGNQDLQQRMAKAVDLDTYSEVLSILEERMNSINYSCRVAMERGLLGYTGYYMRHRSHTMF